MKINIEISRGERAAKEMIQRMGKVGMFYDKKRSDKYGLQWVNNMSEENIRYVIDGHFEYALGISLILKGVAIQLFVNRDNVKVAYDNLRDRLNEIFEQ